MLKKKKKSQYREAPEKQTNTKLKDNFRVKESQ